MKGIQEICSELSHLIKSKYPDLETLKVYLWIRKIILDKGYKKGQEHIKKLIREGENIPI